jgi:hypothetical protein
MSRGTQPRLGSLCSSIMESPTRSNGPFITNLVPRACLHTANLVLGPHRSATDRWRLKCMHFVTECARHSAQQASKPFQG